MHITRCRGQIKGFVAVHMVLSKSYVLRYGNITQKIIQLVIMCISISRGKKAHTYGQYEPH
jgi:hypothetical protein